MLDNGGLAATELLISEYVIDKTSMGCGSLGTDDSDAADERTVHCTLHESEHVLYEASGVRLLPVVFLTYRSFFLNYAK